jgi:hypothetical protein
MIEDCSNPGAVHAGADRELKLLLRRSERAFREREDVVAIAHELLRATQELVMLLGNQRQPARRSGHRVEKILVDLITHTEGEDLDSRCLRIRDELRHDLVRVRCRHAVRDQHDPFDRGLRAREHGDPLRQRVVHVRPAGGEWQAAGVQSLPDDVWRMEFSVGLRLIAEQHEPRFDVG